MPYKQPKSPYWWISYTDGSGRRIRRSSETDNHAEAKALEQRLRADGHDARQVDQTAITFAAVALDYLKPRLKRTGADREKVIIGHLRAHFGALDMATIKPADVTAYKEAREASGTSDSTICRELAVLSAMINHYSTEHMVAMPNPVKGRKPKQGESRVRWISREEAGQLLENAAEWPYLADFIRIGLHTGMRKQEILGLEWSRVNLGERLIFLEASHTKGKKRRSIPINETTRQALLSRWNWTRRHCPDTRWVFCLEGGERLGNIRKSFLTACQRSGITDFRPHDLRHTCAAWLVSSGVSLTAVRDLLGHSSVTVTEIYAHLAPAAVRAAVGVLDDAHTARHTEPESGSYGGTRTCDTSIMNIRSAK